MYKALLAITLFSLAAFSAGAQQQQNDFNYSFNPTPRYSLESKVQVMDSVTNKVSWKQDSTGKGLAIFVKKEGNEFTIGNIFNPTSIVYKEEVVFKGVDSSGSLVYESTKETHERVVVNPIQGFVVVTFFNCEKSKFAKNREDCDKVVHLFGNAPKTYKP
jgi:hypothetical protein